jgi:tight adherence protein B
MAKLLRTFAIAVALVVVPSAAAATEIRGVDSTDYPTVRFTVTTAEPSGVAPVVTEGGAPVAGLEAENLGRAKSVVLAVDRSFSMHGQPLTDAVGAARAFVAAKPGSDRIAIATFATRPVLLTGFSTSTTDADTALRSITVDQVQGTTLYDALVLGANSLASEPLLARVMIVVTDGNETRSDASLDQAIAAAREAGASVYVVGIESDRFTPEPLRRLAAETGGRYYGAASSAALDDVYASIAQELRRTWQVSYVTASRPGEELALVAKAGDQAGTATFSLPGKATASDKEKPSTLLPRSFLHGTWGGLAVGGAVAFLVLLAAVLAFAAPRGSWLRSRLAPHLGERQETLRRAQERDRLAMASGLFRATERSFGHLKFWRKLQTMLERADLPLRTVEFVYVMAACGLVVGMIVAAFGPPRLVGLGALFAGALLPYGFAVFRAKKRLRSFDAQLPDLLTTIAASLKAGHSFRQGIQAVVEEGQEPSSKEFGRVLTETRLGRPMDGALAEMSRRVGSKNLEFVLTAVTIQRQVGGSLATIFDMVAETVRNRHQFARKVKGLTAMGRASAYVLIALPFFLAGVVTLMNAEYMAPLYHTSTGHKLMITGLVMIGIGSLILRKIVSFRG